MGIGCQSCAIRKHIFFFFASFGTKGKTKSVATLTQNKNLMASAFRQSRRSPSQLTTKEPSLRARCRSPAERKACFAEISKHIRGTYPGEDLNVYRQRCGSSCFLDAATNARTVAHGEVMPVCDQDCQFSCDQLEKAHEALERYLYPQDEPELFTRYNELKRLHCQPTAPPPPPSPPVTPVRRRTSSTYERARLRVNQPPVRRNSPPPSQRSVFETPFWFEKQTSRQ